MINIDSFNNLKTFCSQKSATLIAVSKTKPIEAIEALYALGQRDFGENYVQELVAKEAALPKDIRWHFIGHLQSNKVKYIAPFVYLIHGVDSLKLYSEISKQAIKNNKVIKCLLQVHIAAESTKFGLGIDEANALDLNSINNPLSPLCGFMGMASFTEDNAQLTTEFTTLNNCFKNHKEIIANTENEKLKSNFKTLSMGMSGDYDIAIENGSNMIRVGSLLFGSRN
jgi:PLP dependent protein